MKRRLILPAAVVLALVAAAVYFFALRGPPSLVLTGVVTTDDVRVGAQIQGLLEELMVQPGDSVQKKDGTPLDVGRKRRTVSGALKRAVWARDRDCTFPGCDHKHYVDAHHLKHWLDGGPTSVENTALLCTHHHRLLHEGGFRVRRDAQGGLYFQRPDGRVIPRFGYRLADMRDDFEPSAEVREARGVYLVERQVPWGSQAAWQPSSA